MGYLGKISAIVTANTGDFSRNLNAAAADVRKFAGSVQSNLTRAANDAERSFKGIYTPLQTLERSLKAAATMKLSFKGFDGAIRDLNVLKERLTAVKGTQIDLILKASGLRTISEFREAIKDISSESFNFAIKFGGIDKLKLIREELRGVSETSISAVLEAGGLARLKELKETVSGLKGNELALALKVGGTEKLTKVEQQAAGLTRKDMSLLVKVGGADALDKAIEELSGVKSRSLDALVNVKGVAELDKIIATFQKLPPQKIQAVFEALGARDLQQAVNRFQQLVSVAKAINEPLARGASTLAGLSMEVQAGFLPAMKAAQNAADGLNATIQEGGTIGEQRFARYERRVLATVDAIDRLKEASDLASAVPTGRGLAFVRPGVRDDLTEAARVGRAAEQLPASLIEGRRLRPSVELLSQASQLVVQREAELSRAEVLKVDTTQARSNLDNARLTLSRVVAEISKRLTLNVRTDAAERSIEQFKTDLLSISSAVGPPTAMETLREATLAADAAVKGLNNSLDKTKLSADIESLRGDMAAAVAMPEGEMRNRAIATLIGRARGISGAAEGVNVGASTPLPPGYLESRTREKLFGRDIEDPRRQIDSFVGRTNALKGQIDQLSPPFRSTMVSAIRAAEIEVLNLHNNIKPAADEVARVNALLLGVESQLRKISRLDAFKKAFGNIDEYLSSSQIRRAEGEMEALRGVLGGAKDTPRNRKRVQAAKDAYTAFFQAQQTELGLPNTATDAQRAAAAKATAAAREQAVTATASATGMSRSRVRRIIARGGDIGRMGADSASLALNQLAFAIDDFMSSTGGIEFKLRAISNNITQMAFVLGGTTGLFIGLAAVFSSQLAIGLMKWSTNGKTAEDQTKALNDALSKQKALVDAVAESFRTLAGEMTSGTVSEGGKVAQDIASLERAQIERRRGDLAGADPDVLMARAEQARIERELGDESTPGRRAVLQRQLQRAIASEQAAVRRAAGAPPPSGQDVIAGINNAARGIETARAAARTLGRPYEFIASVFSDFFTGTADTGAIRRFAGGVNAGAGVDAIQSQIEALNKTNDVLAVSAKRRTVFGSETRESKDAETNLAKNATRLAQLQNELTKAVDSAMLSLIDSIRGPSQSIRDAQEAVADAIKQGVPGARGIKRELDAAGMLLSEGLREFQDAQSEANPAARLNREIIARQKIDAAIAQQRDPAARAAALRYEMAVNPREQAAAVEARARENLSAAGLGDGRLSRRMREIEESRRLIREQAARPEFQVPGWVDALDDAEAALNSELAAIEAVTIAIRAFAVALDKASEEVRGNLNSAQQAADEARRADLGFSTPQTQEDRRRAEANLERQREIERRAQTEIAVERDRLEQMQRPDAERLRVISDQLANGGAGVDREALIRERETLKAKIEDDARASAFKTDAIRDESTTASEAAKAAARGRDLMMAPRDRRLRDLMNGAVKDLTAAANEDLAAGLNPADRLGQGVRNQIEQVAPMLRQFGLERETAALQGPSRAALTISDTTTSQGQSELFRMLRGDDPNREVDLAELRTQTGLLKDLIDAVRAANPQVVF